MSKTAPEAAAPAAEKPATETPSSEKSLAARFAQSVRDAGAAAPEKKTPDDKDTPPPGTQEDPAPDKKEGSAPATEDPSKGADDVDPDAKVEGDIKKATAGMSAAHKAAFTNLRYSERDFKRKLAAAEKELAALKETAAKPADTAAASEDVTRLQSELESTRAKLAEYEGEIKVSRIEATDEFKSRIEAPKKAIGAEAEKLATKYKLADKAVLDAFHSGDSEAVAAVTADMNEYDRYRFYDLVSKFEALTVEETRMREHAGEELERISRARREEQEVTQRSKKEEWDKTAPAAWEELLEDFPALAPVDGDAEWNKSVESVREFATPSRYGSLTTREQVEVLHRAAAFPVLKAEFETIRQELVKAQAELSKYEGASPDVRGGGDESPADTGEDTDIPLSQRLAARLRKAGLAR
jgi:hypothetical protein